MPHVISDKLMDELLKLARDHDANLAGELVLHSVPVEEYDEEEGCYFLGPSGESFEGEE